jgi:hypothetical protein
MYEEGWRDLGPNEGLIDAGRKGGEGSWALRRRRRRKKSDGVE